MGTVTISPGRLREIREARELSQIQLAESLSLTNAAISAYETGRSRPSAAVLEAAAAQLNVPIEFFLRPERVPRPGVAYYRSLASATKRARTKAEHRLQWLMDIVAYMTELVDLPAVNLPDFDVPDNPLLLNDDDVEAFANDTRAYWGMSDGPVANMTRLVESNGVVTCRDNLGSRALDSLAYRTPDRPFIIIGEDNGTAVRWRYDTAHELGHLVLHSHLDQRTVCRSIEAKEIEAQAHRFAGAFLLPLRPFSDDLYSASLDTFYNMKAKWRVSIGAMISRAGKADLISAAVAEKLWINLSRRGWKRHEPLDDRLEAEQPRMLAEAQAVILREGHSVDGLRQAVALSDFDIETLCGLPHGYLREADAPSVVSRTTPGTATPTATTNVVQFPRARP